MTRRNKLPALPLAACLCLALASGAEAAAYATVTFRAGYGGTLRAAADGVPIASGDLALVGKSVMFTAVPDAGYGNVGWRVNGADIIESASKLTLAVMISNGAGIDVEASFEKLTFPSTSVVFGATGGGTLTAAVDGVQIASGESVAVGKNVMFTAVPDEWCGNIRWRINGADIRDSSVAYTLAVGISNEAGINISVSFDICAEPPDTSLKTLSGVLTFGPNPVRSGGEAAIFWTGSKEIDGDLFVFNALGDKVATVNVSGVGKIGAWNTAGIVNGTYMIKGMLKDKDGFNCRVLMLIGVVR